MSGGLLLAVAVLTGSVTDPTDRPVAGAEVVLESAGRLQVATAGTDEQGRFRLEAPPGRYRVVVSRAGLSSASQVVDLSVARSVTILVQLSLSPVQAEVTVAAESSRVEELHQAPQRVTVIPRSVLEERSLTTLAEVAEGEPGLHAQRTSPAMGGMFVRGLTGKNVAVYRDGIRYSTSAQRGGVSTFFNLLEPSTLDSVEVLRGPSSAQYGSDSLGGTVHLLSREPPLRAGAQSSASAEGGAFYQSAAHAFGSTAALTAASARLAVSVNLAGRRINTLRAGQGDDSRSALRRFFGLPLGAVGLTRLPDTGFTQYGGALHTRLALSARRQVVAHYERGQQDGSRRWDQLLGGDGNLIADIRNLMLDFGYVRYQAFGGTLFDQIAVGASHSAQREERVNQGGQGNATAAITHQYERTATWGGQLVLDRRLASHALAAGADAYRERMRAPSHQFSPVTGAVTLVRNRIPDGAFYLSYGFFVQDVWELGRDLRLSGAIRLSAADYRSHLRTAAGRVVSPEDSYGARALSGRGGAVWSPREFLSIHGRWARGFRAPNVTDLGTLGLQGNGFFETSYEAVAGLGGRLGDSANASARDTGVAVSALRPETSDSFEGGFTVRTGRLRAETTAIVMTLNHLVVSQTLILPAGAAGRPLGDQVISGQLPSGAVLVPISTQPVLIRANAGGVLQRGLEQSFRLRMSPAWSAGGAFTWMHSADRATKLPPDLEPGLPPATASFSALYSPSNRRLWFEAHTLAAGRQSRLSSLALADRRIGASRTRDNIAAFFNRGAAVRGYVVGGRLVATGETLAEVQRRVLGELASAPLYTALAGYAVVTVRGGVPLGRFGGLMVECSNLADRNWRGIGSGVDGAGRSINFAWRTRF